MSIFSGLIPSKPLMKWREPNAYVRKGLSRGKWIILLIVFMIPSLLIFAPHHLFLGSFFTFIGILCFIGVMSGSGGVVCLKEDYITDGVGRSADRSRYSDIECCNVYCESYNGTKFYLLKFIMKKERHLPPGQVKAVAVPDDVNLEQVLQIFRDKGVKVVEEH
jgi:hypothetical protein